MIEANVGIGVLPESAANRYKRVMGIHIVPLSDDWAMRSLQICVRGGLELLPPFARDLIELLIADEKRERDGTETPSPDTNVRGRPRIARQPKKRM